jgi:hypothetical protein
MTAKDLRKAIVHYLGRNPGENVRQLVINHEASISEWNVPEKQPTAEELQTIIDNNKATWEAEKEQILKDAKRIYLKKEIYLRQQINEDVTEFQNELNKLTRKQNEKHSTIKSRGI